MYLSCLLIDVGNNPDRPRPGRLWLRNVYRVHQRLCMAFPYPATKVSDPKFLKPYRPGGFRDPWSDHGAASAVQEQTAASAAPQPPTVHVPRDSEHNFLFRIDPQPGGRVVILVLSAVQPDWDYAFQNAAHFLRCFEVKLFSPILAQGQRLRFRLAANPTQKKDTLSKEQRLAKVPKRHGHRVPVRGDEASLRNWLERHAQPAGFRLESLSLIQAGYVYFNKTREAGQGQRLRSVRYEGILEVVDAQSFRQALIRGIGPAKAFGFGLLSIAPA